MWPARSRRTESSQALCSPRSSAGRPPIPPRARSPRTRCEGSRARPARATRRRSPAPRRPSPPPPRAPGRTRRRWRRRPRGWGDDERAQQHDLDHARAELELPPGERRRHLLCGYDRGVPHLRRSCPVMAGNSASMRNAERAQPLVPRHRGRHTVRHDLGLGGIGRLQVHGLHPRQRDGHDGFSASSTPESNGQTPHALQPRCRAASDDAGDPTQGHHAEHALTSCDLRPRQQASGTPTGQSAGASPPFRPTKARVHRGAHRTFPSPPQDRRFPPLEPGEPD